MVPKEVVAEKQQQQRLRDFCYNSFSGQQRRNEMDVYQQNGYKSRRDYLECLADEMGIELDTVLFVASILGPDEDFDGLVTSIEDMME
jgi:hypothetical protein